jgi:hypothetical protein
VRTGRDLNSLKLKKKSDNRLLTQEILKVETKIRTRLIQQAYDQLAGRTLVNPLKLECILTY